MEKGVRRTRLEESRKKVKLKLLTVFICFVLIIIAIQFTKVDEGKIVEEGKPNDLFNHPKSLRLKEFLNNIN